MKKKDDKSPKKIKSRNEKDALGIKPDDSHLKAVAHRWREAREKSEMSNADFEKHTRKTMTRNGWSEDEVNRIVRIVMRGAKDSDNGKGQSTDKPVPKVTPAQPKKAAKQSAGKRSEPKTAALKNEPKAAKKAASAKNKAADKLLKHSDKDEMNVLGEKPIVINAKNAKPKRAHKVLRRVVRTGGYTAWDDIKKSGKTFETEKEARDYAADVLKKTGKVVPVSFTNKQVTHTFKPEEEKKKK